MNIREVLEMKLGKPLRNIMRKCEKNTEISQNLLWLAPQKSKLI